MAELELWIERQTVDCRERFAPGAEGDTDAAA
jgi:hypothetical protein